MATLRLDEILVIVSDSHMIELEYDLASTVSKVSASYKHEIDWFYNQDVILNAI